MTGVYRAGFLLVVVALLVGGGLLLLPDWSTQVWSAGALAASTVVVAEVFFSLAPKQKDRSVFEAALVSWSPAPDRPMDLQKLERSLGWKSYSAAEYDNRVRPVLRRAASSRLGQAEPPGELARLMSDVPTEGSVATSDIEAIVTQIERL